MECDKEYHTHFCDICVAHHRKQTMWPPPPPPPPTPSIGQLIYEISQEPAPGQTLVPYPTYNTGYEATAYQSINSTLSSDLNNSAYTDLRSAYLDPLTFPPSTLLTDLSLITMPSGLSSLDQQAWQQVAQQLHLEVTYLVSLYNFWTEAQVSVNTVSIELNNRFTQASSVLNDNSASGGISFTAILTTIIGLNPDTAPIATILGLLYWAVDANANTNLSGELNSLQDQLYKLMQSSAQNVTSMYQNIAQSWGQLQQFYTIVASAATSLLATDLTIIGNQYEIFIYQSVIPSIMAIVSSPNTLWGDCACNNSGLGYIPSSTGQNGYNGDFCNRLSDIGANLSDVVNQQNGWPVLQKWNCVSTFKGSSCYQVS